MDTCLVDLFDLCPACNVCHWERVIVTMYADAWFEPSPVTNQVTPAPPRFR